jgi:hypothetical protein
LALDAAAQRAPPTAFPRTLRRRKHQRCAVGFGSSASRRCAATALAPLPRLRAAPARSASRASHARCFPPPGPAPRAPVTARASFLLAVEVFGGSPGSEVKESQPRRRSWFFSAEREREE